MPTPQNFTGQVLGRYQINGIESAGGTGDVYRATDLQPNGHAVVSLRIFEARGRGSAGGASGFVEAGERLSRLRHPHWIPVLEHGESGDLRFVVTAHVDGRSLSRLMLDPALRRREQLALIADAVCRQIGSALVYLHEHGVLHGLVDMHTIVHAADGRFLLSGAGFGCDFVSREDTDARFLIAALDRAAQDSSGAAVADGSGDLFALGAVLYELVCGMPLSVFADAGYQAPPIPGGMLPRPLQDVIHTLIEPHPNDRYATAREVIAALDGATLSHRRMEAPLPTAARRPDALPQAASVIRAPAPANAASPVRRLLLPALAGALVACLGGAYAVSQAGANGTAASNSDLSGARNAEAATPTPEQRVFGSQTDGSQPTQPQITFVAPVITATRASLPAISATPDETPQTSALPATLTLQPAQPALAQATISSTATPAVTRAAESITSALAIEIDLTAVAIHTPVPRVTVERISAPTRTPAVLSTATVTQAPTRAPSRTPTSAPTRAPTRTPAPVPPTAIPTTPPTPVPQSAPIEAPPTATAPPIDGDVNLPQPIDVPPPSDP